MAAGKRTNPRGEHPLLVVLFAAAALTSYAFLPDEVRFLPRGVIPVVGALMLVPLLVVNRLRLDSEEAWIRWWGIVFAVALTLVNQVYVVRVIMELVNGSAVGQTVLLVALAVWITNVISFGLIYWELDRGGPVQRRMEGSSDGALQDFRFPQQDGQKGARVSWEPGYFDYFYFSLSNMMAFSATDVMPLTTRAKALMAYQSLTGFVLLALVISRAVNILT